MVGIYYAGVKYCQPPIQPFFLHQENAGLGSVSLEVKSAPSRSIPICLIALQPNSLPLLLPPPTLPLHPDY